MRKTTHLLTTTSLIGFNNDNGTEFNTCTGRIVWGHPLKPQDKTDDNGVKVLDNSGQPVKQWSFGVAFPKAEFEQQIWPVLFAETSKGYPNGVPPKYSYKYKDGDDPSPVWANGKQLPAYNTREGYPGHYVLTFSTEFQAPGCYIYQNGAYVQIGADQIKTGDFVQVGASTKWHAGQSPGLYVNPLTVLLCWEGDPLGGSYTADPTKTFGAAPQMAAPPPGARPIGSGAPMQQPPQGGGMPGMGAGSPMGQPQGMQPQQMPGQTPGYGQQPMGNPGAAAMGQPAMTNAPMQQPMGANPAGGYPSNQTQPGQPGGFAAPMSHSNQQLPPPATDFIPGGQPQGMPMQQPQQMGNPGGMPGMPQR